MFPVSRLHSSVPSARNPYTFPSVLPMKTVPSGAVTGHTEPANVPISGMLTEPPPAGAVPTGMNPSFPAVACARDRESCTCEVFVRMSVHRKDDGRYRQCPVPHGWPPSGSKVIYRAVERRRQTANARRVRDTPDRAAGPP